MNVIEKNVSKQKIFKSFPPTKHTNKLLLTTEGIYSVSGYDASKHLAKLILKFFKGKKDLIITDATANNGSDTITLALYFKHINAIEKDNTNFSVLQNNVNVFNLKNISLFHDSLINIIPTIKQDIIFLDAPWKTSMDMNYKEQKNLKLFIDNIEISDIYKNFKQYCKLFIFKVPFNYDFSYFIQNTLLQNYSIISYSYHNKIKFFYIFIQS
jgi:hypothetical protein